MINKHERTVAGGKQIYYTLGDNPAKFGKDDMEAIKAYTDKEVAKAERPFYEAFNNKGKTPSYHDRQVERLRREWRVLYNALSQLKGDK